MAQTLTLRNSKVAKDVSSVTFTVTPPYSEFEMPIRSHCLKVDVVDRIYNDLSVNYAPHCIDQFHIFNDFYSWSLFMISIHCFEIILMHRI